MSKLTRQKPTSYSKEPYRQPDLVRKVETGKALTNHYAKKGTKKK